MLSLQGISKIYTTGEQEFQALRNVTFSVKSGEFVAIMGPSGSGKSTLMHILGALDTPSSGKYLLDNTDVSTLTDDELSSLRRHKIGFVFQAFNLLPRTTVLRNTMLPLIYANTPESERYELSVSALRSAGLSDNLLDRHPSQLSGGQIQRVAIARALVNNPVLILADEPTGNLDTKTGKIVLGTFRQLNHELKRTIILITHEHDVALHADRIIQLLDGEVVDDKPTRR